jgi:hypothetical protein
MSKYVINPEYYMTVERDNENDEVIRVHEMLIDESQRIINARKRGVDKFSRPPDILIKVD